MRSNRFDFLEFNDQNSDPALEHSAEIEEGLVRFDPPAPPAEPSVTVSTGGLEQVIHHHRRILRVMEVFGSRGTIAGAFSYPTGVAVDKNGVVFVADAYNHRLQRISPDGGVAIVGSRGTGRGQFLAPMGVAVDEDRAFYIVEQGNHRVQKFSCDGVLELVFGREGSRQGEFRSPIGIIISQGTRLIYVADTGNGRVQVFNKEGRYVGVLGAIGGIHPLLTNPQAVACDGRGNVFVADTLSHRIVQFDPAGRFVAFYGGPPSPSNRLPELSLTEPHALAFDERGRLLIADGIRSHGRLIVVSPETGVIDLIMENVGRGLGHLAKPGGIAAAPVMKSKLEPGAERGDIYVSDTMNHRILRFVWS